MGFGQPGIFSEPRPMQVRFFQAHGVGDLETRINQWLSEDAKREIVDVRQTSFTSPDHGAELVVSVWYMET